jgi:hypothetical protein
VHPPQLVSRDHDLSDLMLRVATIGMHGAGAYECKAASPAVPKPYVFVASEVTSSENQIPRNC